MMRDRILVAMSGGVDSSVAAGLLQQAGYDCIGITMQMWPKSWCTLPPTPKSCCSVRDTHDARSVAESLGMPFYVIDLSVEFQSGVIDYFTDAYARGETPNPCIACNDDIKFGALLKHADMFGATKVATGHYAQLVRDPHTQRYGISRGVDHKKDQSYVLFGLEQWQLERTLLPLGRYSKADVRAMAEAQGYVTADKAESMDICFLRGGDKERFLEQRIVDAQRPGVICDRQGHRLGMHTGAWKYTVGQREGLGIAAAHRLYVLHVDTQQNVVVVGPREELVQRTFRVGRLNAVAEMLRTGRTYDILVQVRSHHTPVPARVEVHLDREATVTYIDPQLAVSPGQAAVFYRAETIIGGGWVLPGVSPVIDATTPEVMHV
jgi:tRNA-uridine 2-sulfurtransferase